MENQTRERKKKEENFINKIINDEVKETTAVNEQKTKISVKANPVLLSLI